MNTAADSPQDDSGSSIPFGAIYYQYPIAEAVLRIKDSTGAVFSVVHEAAAFLDDNPARPEPVVLIRLRSHLNASMNPNGTQVRLIEPVVKKGKYQVSMLAERVQLGYRFDPNVVQRGPEPQAYAPTTRMTEISDTQTSETKVQIDLSGPKLSFGVKDKVTISVTDWVVSLSAASSQVVWDYWVMTPWNMKNSHAPAFINYPNISLTGFSFDTSAWFEVSSKQETVTFQPVLQATVTALLVNVFDNRVPNVERYIRGDVNIPDGPFFQPALEVDLRKVTR
jgi:hypothetical protein